MSNLESNVWGKKKFSDILKEIYDNQKKKETQISALIGELKPLINDIGDATLIVPLIKEYMELGIKNDEQLVKMATIVQRALASNKSEDESFGMTDNEKTQLLAEVKKFNPKDSMALYNEHLGYST
jgi:methanogenic corrinoid protein MtbC1